MVQFSRYLVRQAGTLLIAGSCWVSMDDILSINTSFRGSREQVFSLKIELYSMHVFPLSGRLVLLEVASRTE